MRYDLSKDKSRAEFMLKVKEVMDNKKIVTLTVKNKNRSLNQNSYIHSLFGLFGIHFGLTLDESKQLIKAKFLTYEKKGKDFVKRTRDLDTKEMTIFIDKFRAFSSEHNCYLPTPDEFGLNEDYYLNEIEKHERYL